MLTRIIPPVHKTAVRIAQAHGPAYVAMISHALSIIDLRNITISKIEKINF
jgi:hypothetical protein